MSVVLTINLGTESSKVGIFNEKAALHKKTINHSKEELRKNMAADKQVEYRKKMIEDWMKEVGVSMAEIDAVAVRIAILPKSVAGGTYKIEGQLETDVMKCYDPGEMMPHGSHIILPLVKALTTGLDIPLFLSDPANINELIPEAKLSGLPMIERDTCFHALNQKMCAREEAAKLGKAYRDCNFVIAHMGGGTSVAAHQKGRVIDVNNCAGEEGCFSPSRTGTLPARKLINLIFDKNLTRKEALELTRGKGGVYAYLGTSDIIEVERRIQNGDELADLVIKSFAYRTAKEIGACVAALAGDVDAIIITGGIAHSQRIINLISDRVKGFAPISVYPGELEGEALAAGAERVLSGKEAPMTYA